MAVYRCVYGLYQNVFRQIFLVIFLICRSVMMHHKLFSTVLFDVFMWEANQKDFTVYQFIVQ